MPFTQPTHFKKRYEIKIAGNIPITCLVERLASPPSTNSAQLLQESMSQETVPQSLEDKCQRVDKQFRSGDFSYLDIQCENAAKWAFLSLSYLCDIGVVTFWVPKYAFYYQSKDIFWKGISVLLVRWSNTWFTRQKLKWATFKISNLLFLLWFNSINSSLTQKCI